MISKAISVLEEQYTAFEAIVLDDEKKAWEAKKKRESYSKKKPADTKSEAEEELEFEEKLKEALSKEQEGLLMTATHIKTLLELAIDADNAIAAKVCLPHKSYTRLLRYCIKKLMPYAFQVKAPLGISEPGAAIVAGPDEVLMGHIVDYYNADDIEAVEKEIAAEKEYLRKQEELEAERKRKEREAAERARVARERALAQLETDPEFLALDDEEKKKKVNALAQKLKYDLDRKAEAYEKQKKKREEKKPNAAPVAKKAVEQPTIVQAVPTSDNNEEEHEESEYLTREALASFDMKKAQLSLFDFFG